MKYEDIRAIAQTVKVTGLGMTPSHIMQVLCGQCGTREGFLQVLQFPLPILILPSSPYHPGLV
jgi:hypothetical protein